MKAAAYKQYGGPEVLEILDLPMPKPEKNDVLIKVFASSVNPVDYKTRMGNHRLILGSHFPIIPGYDVCGEVIDIGDEVTRFKKGDMVFGRLDKKYGKAWAEYALGSENCLAIKPSELPVDEAAALPLAALTALQALRDKGHIMPGDKVLINGASGGVGHFALQLAKIAGAETWAVCSSRHEGLMQSINPDHWIDYTKEDFKSLGIHFDLIFDIHGNESFRSCMKVLAPNGVYISTLPRPKILIHKLLSWFTKGKKVKTLLMKAVPADLEYVSGLVLEGKLKVCISHKIELQNAVEAFRLIESGHTEGKVVISID